jgi:hypothetical protein
MNAADEITLRAAFTTAASISDILMAAAKAERAGLSGLDYDAVKWLGSRLLDTADDLVVILRAADPNCGILRFAPPVRPGGALIKTNPGNAALIPIVEDRNHER